MYFKGQRETTLNLKYVLFLGNRVLDGTRQLFISGAVPLFERLPSGMQLTACGGMVITRVT